MLGGGGDGDKENQVDVSIIVSNDSLLFIYLYLITNFFLSLSMHFDIDGKTSKPVDLGSELECSC